MVGDISSDPAFSPNADLKSCLRVGAFLNKQLEIAGDLSKGIPPIHSISSRLGRGWYTLRYLQHWQSKDMFNVGNFRQRVVERVFGGEGGPLVVVHFQSFRNGVLKIETQTPTRLLTIFVAPASKVSGLRIAACSWVSGHCSAGSELRARVSGAWHSAMELADGRYR
ncbi:hypothetical protein [Arthrobacter sp. NA-172]|uniref:hypothetical protein n=1 Tax=Arthrobacter sp. NA-172 TaxID=3367524 RepID=UPI00375401F4